MLTIPEMIIKKVDDWFEENYMHPDDFDSMWTNEFLNLVADKELNNLVARWYITTEQSSPLEDLFASEWLGLVHDTNKRITH